jgi:hypothetical protein
VVPTGGFAEALEGGPVSDPPAVGTPGTSGWEGVITRVRHCATMRENRGFGHEDVQQRVVFLVKRRGRESRGGRRRRML